MKAKGETLKNSVGLGQKQLPGGSGPRGHCNKKYVCGWCRKKYVSRIRPPLLLPDGAKHGRVGKSNKVEKLGEPVIIQGHAVSAPGSALFEGSEFTCSVECYENLVGEPPPKE